MKYFLNVHLFNDDKFFVTPLEEYEISKKMNIVLEIILLYILGHVIVI